MVSNLRTSKNGHENGHEIYFLHSSIEGPNRPSPTKPGTSINSQHALVDSTNAFLPTMGGIIAMAGAEVARPSHFWAKNR